MRRLPAALAWLAAAGLPVIGGADEHTAARQTAAISQEVYEALRRAQEQVESGDHGAALSDLEALRGRGGLSDYERAQTWNLSAYVHYLQEDHAAAIDAYERLLAWPQLPQALVQSAQKTLAQIYFIEERYAKSATITRRLLRQLERPDPDLFLLLGQAHYQLQQYRQALAPLETAVRRYRERGVPPEENWLLLLYSIHYELSDYDALLPVLRELIRLYPDDRHLLSLAGVYGERADTARQLALTEALYESGALDATRYAPHLANLYLLHGLPYKAATVLQEAIDAGALAAKVHHLRLLSEAWQQAQEPARAIAPLRRAAAQAADGRLYVRLAQAHARLEQWPQAARVLQQALDKGGLENRHQVHILLGTALFNQRHYHAARTAFEAALQHADSRKTATRWLAHIDRELALQKALPPSPE